MFQSFLKIPLVHKLHEYSLPNLFSYFRFFFSTTYFPLLTLLLKYLTGTVHFLALQVQAPVYGTSSQSSFMFFSLVSLTACPVSAIDNLCLACMCKPYLLIESATLLLPLHEFPCSLNC